MNNNPAPVTTSDAERAAREALAKILGVPKTTMSDGKALKEIIRIARQELAREVHVGVDDEAVPAVTLSDAQCSAIYYSLDKFGRDLDHYDYGLPLLSDDGHKEEVFKIIRDIAAPKHPSPQSEEGSLFLGVADGDAVGGKSGGVE